MTRHPSVFRVEATAHHRNGVSGAPFDAVLFDHDDSRKVAILFDAPSHCAVLDVAKLAAGDITFGSNPWRGDVFEKTLRQHLATISSKKGTL
jgi:hypothetical protein